MKDQNGNSIVLATRRRHEGKKSVTLKAQTDLQVDAAEIKASSGVKVKGSGTAEISSSGKMTVKGSLVMIN